MPRKSSTTKSTSDAPKLKAVSKPKTKRTNTYWSNDEVYNLVKGVKEITLRLDGMAKNVARISEQVLDIQKMERRNRYRWSW